MAGGDAVQNDPVAPQVDALHMHFAGKQHAEFAGGVSRVKDCLALFKVRGAHPPRSHHLAVFRWGNALEQRQGRNFHSFASHFVVKTTYLRIGLYYTGATNTRRLKT